MENIALVSEEEYKKALSRTKDQPSEQTTIDASIKVDTQVKDGQIDLHKEVV